MKGELRAEMKYGVVLICYIVTFLCNRCVDDQEVKYYLISVYVNIKDGKA